MTYVEECRCRCHETLDSARGEGRGGTVSHPYQCCTRCPDCGFRVKMGFAEHREHCQARKDRLEREAKLAELKEAGFL